MNFNEHSRLNGLHAFLSPSKYHWMNYNEQKLVASYSNFLAAQYGTRLHAFACEAILLGIKLPRTAKTLNSYVNDCIGFRMTTEQPLYYSDNCFGTCDAISFKNKQLRIFDLKTGSTKASIHQLEVYAAIFCLEYKIDPESISIEFRIYQSDETLIANPEPALIKEVMNTIIEFDKKIQQIDLEV